MSIKNSLQFIFITNCTNFLNMIFALANSKLASKEIFSLFSTVTSLILSLGAIYQIAHFLISKHIVKHKINSKTEIGNIINTILYVSLILGILITVVSIIIFNFIHIEVTINVSLVSYMFFTTFLVCFSNSKMGILNGLEKHNQYSIFLFLTSLIRLFFLFLLFLIINISYSPFLANIFANLFLTILLINFFKQKILFFNFSIFMNNILLLFKSFYKEKRIVIFNILILFLLYIDTFLFSINKSTSQISEYAVHSMFAKILYFFSIPLSIYLFPKFSKKEIHISLKSILMIFFTMMMFNIIFFFLIKYFFLFFYGQSYIFNPNLFFYLIIIFSIFSIFQISGEYLSTRYVDKSYIYLILFLVVSFITINLINNIFFVESLCGLLIVLLSINLCYYFKKDLPNV